MSVIAWDGTTLAADNQATLHGRSILIEKLVQLEEGVLAAYTGDHEEGQMLVAWYEAGAIKENWPDFQRPDDFTTLIIVENQMVYQYQAHPHRVRIEAGCFAWGEGAPYALGAMRAGADAALAVEIANHYSIFCGLGVTKYTAEEQCPF